MNGNGYGSVLQGLMQSAPPTPASVGMGAPPSMPGLPPPPTGVGAMPTGDASTTQKAAADQAILALRQASGFFPSMSTAINGMIDQLKASSKSSAPQPVGTPKAPGAPVPAANPLPESGSAGEV